MTDALSASARADRARRAKDAYLDAALAFLEEQSQERYVAPERAFGAQYEGNDPALMHLRARLMASSMCAMLAGDEQAWTQFIALQVGFRDAKRLERYRRLSPFNDCWLVLVERGADGSTGAASGETSAFFAAMRDDTLVETKRFRFFAGTPLAFDLLALRPLLLR